MWNRLPCILNGTRTVGQGNALEALSAVNTVKRELIIPWPNGKYFISLIFSVIWAPPDAPYSPRPRKVGLHHVSYICAVEVPFRFHPCSLYSLLLTWIQLQSSLQCHSNMRIVFYHWLSSYLRTSCRMSRGPNLRSSRIEECWSYSSKPHTG